MQLAQIRDFGAGEVVEDIPTIKGFEVIFNNLVTVAIAFAGLVLFIMFIWGGFQMLTAGGEAPKVEAARKTLTYAVGGIALLVLSYFILNLIQTITGAQITDFTVFQ